MKAMVCEMCNSNDIQKQDGVYVCQSCGTKYTVEEAKKLMIDGTVNVVGTVSIDNSASYDRIVELARDAYQDKRFESAYDYYCQAVDIKQDVVENVLRQGLSILAKEAIQSNVPSSCTNRISRAVDLINQMPADEEKNRVVLLALEDLVNACEASRAFLEEEINDLEFQKMKTRSAGDILADLGRPQFVAAQNQAEDKKIERHNKAIDEKIEVVKTRSAKINEFETEYEEKILKCADVNVQFAHFYKKRVVEKVEELYPQITLSKEEQKKLTEEINHLCWAANYEEVNFVKVLIEMGSDVNVVSDDSMPSSPLFKVAAFAPANDESKQRRIAIVKLLLDNGAIVNPDEKNSFGRTLANNQTPEEIKQMLIAKNPDVANKIGQAPKAGCYVATAVYGSYDCPEVWTLRRYRDYTLAETWYGRAFIRLYYATSPMLVKWFGETEWFKKMWKGKLDRMVESLNKNGVDDTPYSDKKW